MRILVKDFHDLAVLSRRRFAFAIMSIFLTLVVATAASGHGPLTTLTHPQEGICCHYSSPIDWQCTGNNQAQITAVAQNFDNNNQPHDERIDSELQHRPVGWRKL